MSVEIHLLCIAPMPVAPRSSSHPTSHHNTGWICGRCPNDIRGMASTRFHLLLLRFEPAFSQLLTLPLAHSNAYLSETDGLLPPRDNVPMCRQTLPPIYLIPAAIRAYLPLRFHRCFPANQEMAEGLRQGSTNLFLWSDEF